MTAAPSCEQQVAEILRELGIAEIFKKQKPFPEAVELVSIGHDIYGREQKLAQKPAAVWKQMKLIAEKDGIVLLIVSAFRSIAHQKQIIQRKLGVGQSIEQILHVSTAPGFSEHHTGRAIDITTPNCKPLTEEFEQTSAFAWLAHHAKNFGFAMTYPRDNKSGVIYELWHWTYQDSN